MAWRRLRTGLGFAYYGLGLVAIAAWLGLRSAVGAPLARDAAQRLLQHGYDSFVTVMQALGLLHLRESGLEALKGPGPRLVVVNHPSLIDSALVVRHLPQSDNFVSPTWQRVPFFRSIADGVEAIPSDGGNASVDEAVRRLRAGRCVVMFPEGTRSPRDGLGRFGRGAAHVALRSGCDLIPVVIRMDPPTLKKGERWHEVPDRTPNVELRVMPPLSPGKVLTGDEPPMLAARKLTAALRDLYEKVLDLE